MIQVLVGWVKSHPRLYRAARAMAFTARSAVRQLAAVRGDRHEVIGRCRLSEKGVAGSSGWTREAVASETVVSSPPRSIDGANDDRYPGLPSTTPAWHVFELEHPVISDGEVLVSADGRIVEGVMETAADLAAASLPTSYRRGVHSLGGTSAILACRNGRGYFHWLFDVLPRLHLLESAGIDLDDVDHFVVNGIYASYQRDTLAHLGVEHRRVVSVLRRPFLEPARAFVSSHPRQTDVIPAWLVDFLHARFLPRSPGRSWPERIYITRSRTHHGRPEGEHTLEGMLAELGFASLALEEFTLEEKAAMFAGARAVVGATGAGLSHLAFCRSGTVVVELNTRDQAFHEPWDLCNRVGAEYWYVAKEPSGNMPLDKIRRTLVAAGVR
jgi:capsular polysaccharide biosynthesis protein